MDPTPSSLTPHPLHLGGSRSSSTRSTRARSRTERRRWGRPSPALQSVSTTMPPRRRPRLRREQLLRRGPSLRHHEVDELLSKAHAYNLRLLLDGMPHECSSEHSLFQAALAAVPGSLEREVFHFVRRADGNPERPPSNWQSVFGGPAWSRNSPPGAPHGCHATDVSQT